MTDPAEVEALAALIREVDGSHVLGAAELAEALVARGAFVARSDGAGGYYAKMHILPVKERPPLTLDWDEVD